MTKIKASYLIDRNKQIYDEYITTNTSYNLLAKKYNVSPQRIQYIIADLKNKNLTNNLDISSTKEERETHKDHAVSLRESGKLKIAETMFKEVIAWDEKHANYRGEMDALGHLKLTYKALSDKESNKDLKQKYNQLALNCIEKSIALGETYPDIPRGAITIQKVHMANIIMDDFVGKEVKKAEPELLKAISILNEALSDFPGSEAHKAWPLAAKAKALTLLKNYEEALDVLEQAERKLYEGYSQEITKDDQSDIKLNVWLAGIHLTKAAIYMETGRTIMARHYANSVVNISDPTKVLTIRKTQAKEMLKELNKEV